MPILMARVDNRLLHGQVLEAWVPRLGADAVLAVDRPLSRDPLRRRILEGLGRAGHLEVRVADPEDAAELLLGGWSEKRVLLLFVGLPEALEAHRAGVRFERLNLGNLHPREGSRVISPSVQVTAADCRCLEALLAEGVAVEARAVPSDRGLDGSTILASGKES